MTDKQRKNIKQKLKNNKKELVNIRWELYHYLLAIINNSLRDHFAQTSDEAFSKISKYKEHLIVYRKASSEIAKNLLSDDHLCNIITTILEEGSESNKGFRIVSDAIGSKIQEVQEMQEDQKIAS